MATKFGRFLRRNTIALLALFLALGGTSFAAASLISGKQIKPHTIAKNRLTNSAIKSLKGNRGLQGVRGPTGAQGIQGVPGPFPGTLPGGITIRGEYEIDYTITGAAAAGGDNIAFGFSFASAPTTHVILKGGAVPTGCTGGTPANPKADPGNLCIYEGAFANRASLATFKESAGTTPGADPFGAGLFMFSTAASGTAYSAGTWAATSPTGSAPAHAPSGHSSRRSGSGT